MVPPKFYQKNAKSTKDTVQRTPVRQPWHLHLPKREHADNEIIESRSFPFDGLIPNWNGKGFIANFKNAATAVVLAKTHHVKGEHERTKNSFKDFVFAFCLEPVKRNGMWDRRFNSFTVQSPGCCDHPKLLFKEGPNLAYTYTIQGKPATRGMLKFNETHEPPKPLCKRLAKPRMAQFEERLNIQKQYKNEYEAAGNGKYVLGSIVPPGSTSQASQIPGIGELILKDSTRDQEQQIVNGLRTLARTRGKVVLILKSSPRQGLLANIREETLDTRKKDGKRRLS
ncbi:hypothetical protein N0V91_003679 [Didymella pomorum]|uniref:Uncharacterized protein n=1 Tax=Didymella pomorum TaxID=749634 RepID=A0A9W8ZJW1_9PLEO|nr:hypothetical protein N0V91_003679 [Didymella pomorum]